MYSSVFIISWVALNSEEDWKIIVKGKIEEIKKSLNSEEDWKIFYHCIEAWNTIPT